MDLCGPMRVASINGKRYVLVIVDDYSRYTWTHFLKSKDETPEVLIDFLRLVQRGLQALVRVVVFKSSAVSAANAPNQLTGTSSIVNHNAYMASSSAPQIDYAPMVQHSSEYSPPETRLVVSVFQKGDDPIDAINHMMTNHFPQEMQVPLTSEQSTILTQSNTKIASDSNIISYSQYMNESQYNTIQNSTLPAFQDDLILSVIEQLKTQVVNCTKINQDNKQVNELLMAKLERYRNQERVWNEKKHDDKASTSYEPSLEIESLKHTMSKHLKEKESLEQKITIHKNDLQKEESRNIDRELALEKQAQQLKPKLYDGRIIEKSDVVVIPNTEETLMLAEESRSKMIEKQNDPQMTKKKVITKPIDYVKERTTATAITEDTWGFEHTKVCFHDDIIPFVKALKELFTSFDQCLIDFKRVSSE
nr:ribonuclease H-like domain-containing protein [Tanacetum cinerariifolium]